jgi:hypothetical protein
MVGQKINSFRILVVKQELEGREDKISVVLEEENCEDEGWILSNEEL